LSELELILAALATGAAAGSATVPASAVGDAYTGLWAALRGALAARGDGSDVLDTVRTEPGGWQRAVAAAVAAAGADRDAEVLAAARRVLHLADPDGASAGKYRVDVHGATGVQIGDHTVHVDTNYGAVARTMTGPVTINNPGPVPDPPAAPGV
jgi:hypothetical protein